MAASDFVSREMKCRRFSDTVLPILVNRFLSHLVLSELFRFEEVLAWLLFFFCLFLSYRSNKNGRGLMERGGGEGNERGRTRWEMRVLSRKKKSFACFISASAANGTGKGGGS